MVCTTGQVVHQKHVRGIALEQRSSTTRTYLVRASLNFAISSGSRETEYGRSVQYVPVGETVNAVANIFCDDAQLMELGVLPSAERTMWALRGKSGGLKKAFLSSKEPGVSDDVLFSVPRSGATHYELSVSCGVERGGFFPAGFLLRCQTHTRLTSR